MKKKYNTKLIVALGVIVFFTLYGATFKLVRLRLNKVDQTANVMNTDFDKDGSELHQELEAEKAKERKKSPMQKFNESKKIYISDEEVSDIRIEGESLDSFRSAIHNFVKIRDIDDNFKPLNTGKNSGDLKFKTDFNYFVMETDNKKSIYKIPVNAKKDFKLKFRRMIYTSVNFISDGKSIDKLEVYSGNVVKKPLPWNRKTLVRKILYKREVGKIQPEKEFEKTEENFTIKIEKAGVKLSIQTMGPDFIKVECGDNTAYYEVYPDLYNYLKNDIFAK